VAYATWLIGKYKWICVTFAILGPLVILLGALSSNWFFLALGVAWTALAIAYFLMQSRVRRSIQLNEPFLGHLS
jgi:hypothetical protein